MRPALQPARVLEFAIFVAMALTVLVSLWFRLWHLENIPGVNGDEAWQGVQALDFLKTKSIEWVTPSGKIAGPFFLLPLSALHLVLPPSFTLLRVVAVGSGVLALLLNYLFCRRVFDAETALLSTLLLAVLPVNIAYSRIAWEPSQVLGASAGVVYGSLLIAREEHRPLFWIITAFLAVALALVVHPMCIFLLPFPLVAICWRWREVVADALLFKNRRRGVLAWTGIFWTVVALLLILFGKGDGKALIDVIAGWNVDRSLGSFGLGVLQLFSGDSTYRYFVSGPSAEFHSENIITSLLILLVLLAGWLAWRHGTQEKNELVLPLALAAGMLFFWALLGTAGLTPGNGRYALWMVLPGVLLFVRAGVLVYRQWPQFKWGVQGGFLALSTLLLLGFWLQYFAVFLQTGGHGGPIYETAAQDPKLTALQMILQKQDITRPFVIASSNWWVFWPMRYQAYHIPNLTLLQSADMDTPEGAAILNRAAKSGDLWFAEFSQLPGTAQVRARLKRADAPYTEYSTRTFDGRKVVTIFHQKQSKLAPAEDTLRPPGISYVTPAAPRGQFAR